jgi:hypothetical protein
VRDSNGLDNLFLRDTAVFSDEDFEHYGSIIGRLKDHVMKTFDITELYFTAPTFITRLDGRESWEPQGTFQYLFRCSDFIIVYRGP